MADTFSFTKLVVADLEACEAFYVSVFGLEKVARVSADIAGRPIEEIMFKPTSPGSSSFILLAYADRSTPSSEEVILGMTTEDLDGMIERAIAAGGSLADPPRTMEQHGVRVAFVVDPEGHLIEAVQMLA